MYFMFLPGQMVDALQQIRATGKIHDVVFIVHPGELDLDRRYTPVRVIRNPQGQICLEIFELTI
jgi:hypothetical protein